MGVVFEGAMIGQTDFAGALEFVNGSFGFATDCVDFSGGMHHVVEMVHTAFRYGGFIGKFFGAFEISFASENQTFTGRELRLTRNHLLGPA